MLLHQRRQSLVTPTDWKRRPLGGPKITCSFSRQSLVTPIDWKPEYPVESRRWPCESRQSLVTPTDWKQSLLKILQTNRFESPIFGDAF